MKKILLSLLFISNFALSVTPKPILFLDIHYLIAFNETSPLLEIRELYNKYILEETKNTAYLASLDAMRLQLHEQSQDIQAQKDQEICDKFNKAAIEFNKKSSVFSEKQTDIMNKIKLYAQIIAKQHNACAVINSETIKIYTDPAHDITNEIRNTLNQIYLQTITQGVK